MFVLGVCSSVCARARRFSAKAWAPPSAASGRGGGAPASARAAPPRLADALADGARLTEVEGRALHRRDLAGGDLGVTYLRVGGGGGGGAGRGGVGARRGGRGRVRVRWREQGAAQPAAAREEVCARAQRAGV